MTRETNPTLATALDRLTHIALQEERISFRDLVKAAGLDPAQDFVGASLRELDFRDEDLRGFDFSFADLEGADFRRARTTGARFVGATLTGAIGLPVPLPPAAESALKPGDDFVEDPNGPEMVVVPAGVFRMGSLDDEDNLDKRIHKVTFARPFAMGKFAVTVDEFEAFVAETGHDTGTSAYAWEGSTWELTEGRTWRDPGFPQTGRHPVTCVNWDDATAYANWLSEKTSRPYRLPSEAEWEYAARGITIGSIWTGSVNSLIQAVRAKNKKIVQVDANAPNSFGLYNIQSNVREWVEDCYNGYYHGVPKDGSPSTTGDCNRRLLCGNSFQIPWSVRSRVRDGYYPDMRCAYVGYRLARTLNHLDAGNVSPQAAGKDEVAPLRGWRRLLPKFNYDGQLMNASFTLTCKESEARLF